jgi:tetratricopeptide (TPR) repeat protein
MRILGPYYYGERKWDNYLLDIQQTMEAGASAQRKDVRLQTKALDVAHEQQLSEMRQQTEHVRHLQEAFNTGFEELRAEFEWGFTLMADRMETQIEQLSQIAARLDAIHKTLQSPLLTQARELFQLGLEHYRKGLLDKALEAYLKAEQKNDVDFLLQLQMGTLLLHGRDEDDNVIDLPQAEKHLLLAARYADAEKGALPQWNKYCGQAYHRAAVAAYQIGNQERAQGRPDAMRACLERALGYLSKAAILRPRFTDIVYTQAKCHALLEQIQDALQKFEILSDRDRRYFAKASQDGDFATFRADIEEVFKRATISPGPLARAAKARADDVAEAILWAKRSAPASKEDLMAIESMERELSNVRQSLPTFDVDIEGLNERLGRMRAELEKIAQRALRENIRAAEQAITSCEQRKTSCESAIAQLKQTMSQTSATGVGWLVVILTFLVEPFFIASLASMIPPEMRRSDGLNALFAIAFIAIPFVAGGIGSKLSCDSKNQPHKQQIEEYLLAIEECVGLVPSLRQRAEAWQQEMYSFEAWQAHRPLPPPIRVVLP